jgi:predicted kinase
VETARACGEPVALDEEDLARLDALFPAADLLRRPQRERRPPDDASGEVVILMGYPGAGKSTAAQGLVERGYVRLNRDAEGGTLSSLVPKLDAALAEGARRVVLDNTYAGRAKRNEVIETAWRHGVPVRCAWLQTTIEQARVNAVHRLLDTYGHLLEPEEMAAVSRTDPNAFAPRAQLDYQRDLEAPVLQEGFVTIEQVPLQPRPGGAGKLLLVDVDNVGPIGAVDPQWTVAGFAWRPEGSDRAIEEHGFAVYVCHHPGGPPICWCRPPMPGLVVLALREANADPAASLFVGATSHAERFAAACGLAYASAEAFFRC